MDDWQAYRCARRQSLSGRTAEGAKLGVVIEYRLAARRTRREIHGGSCRF